MLRAFILCLVLFTVGGAAGAVEMQPRLPRALLITGLGTTDPSHPKHILTHEFYNDRIVRILDGIAEVTVTEDLSVLSEERLAAFDLILNNSFLLEPSPPQLAAFFAFVEKGGAYISLHAGLVSFVNSERYVRMMGGYMAGHSPLKPFIVETFEDGFGRERTTPWAHPIVRGLSPFETRDELYVVQTNTDELEVIARAESHPIVWWRPWLNGSVLAFTLGHAEFSLDNAGYQALLQNSVKWLLGYPLVETMRSKVFANSVGTVEDAVNLRRLTHTRGGSAPRFSIENDRPDLVTATVDADDRMDLRFNAGRTGKATIVVTAATNRGLTARSELILDIRERGTGNLAAYHGVTAHSSSNEARYLTADPALVADADASTRWSSDYVDDAWIYLDLRDTYAVERVRLLWDGAYASQYALQVSSDARTWHTVESVKGRGGTEEIRFRPTEGRYVRLHATQRATRYGHSLHEFEVFGRPVSR